MTVEELLFDVTESLRYPVLVLALIALVVVIVELGALAAELRARRGRSVARLERATDAARAALAEGDRDRARKALLPIARSKAMAKVLTAIVELHGEPNAADRIAKRLAEYDYRSLRRLERTRILVRMGPALGLMGTLIPLSPALAALARGDVARLSHDLRVAFGVTVAGLLVGAIAFAISLVRDRLYGQDYSDIEFAYAALTAEPAAGVGDGKAKPAKEAGDGKADPSAVGEPA